MISGRKNWNISLLMVKPFHSSYLVTGDGFYLTFYNYFYTEPQLEQSDWCDRLI